MGELSSVCETERASQLKNKIICNEISQSLKHSRESVADDFLFLCQTSGGGQQLSRGMSLCGTRIFVASRFGFSMWLMVWLAASMPS